MRTKQWSGESGVSRWFVRGARAVGDLGDPFYEEERQRDVWNEASAVGLQLMLWLNLAAATVMVWVGGAPALPYAHSLIAVIGIVSLVTLLYARCLDVRVETALRLLRLRLVPVVVLVVLFAVGRVRALPAEGRGFGVGMAAGVLVAGAVLLASRERARRRERSVDDVSDQYT